MAEPTRAGIEASEDQLRQAMLTGDVAALDALVADTSIFTNQFGVVLAKADDLAAHRSGQLKLTRIDAEDQRIQAIDGGAVVTVLCRLAGSFDGQPFAGAFRYTRVWAPTEKGIQVIAAHCSAVM